MEYTCVVELLQLCSYSSMFRPCSVDLLAKQLMTYSQEVTSFKQVTVIPITRIRTQFCTSCYCKNYIKYLYFTAVFPGLLSFGVDFCRRLYVVDSSILKYVSVEDYRRSKSSIGICIRLSVIPPFCLCLS